MTKFGLSQPVARVEDQRFLRGEGAYVDDLREAGALRAWFLRSPVAHAAITVDAEAARSAPGVRGVWTGADLEAGMANDVKAAGMKNSDGSKMARPRRPVLATERVRHVGEAVAMVVAETLDQARDAAELIEVDYEEAPAAVGLRAAVAEGAPQVHDGNPGNIALDWSIGDEAATDAAFAMAAHVVSLDLVNNKIISSPMEPRGAVARWENGALHLIFNGQGPWDVQGALAKALDLPLDKVRVSHPDVGGGFGTKAVAYPEHFALSFAARELGATIRWMADRSETMQSDAMGRGHATTVEAAFDAEHKLLGLRTDMLASFGAYVSPGAAFIPTYCYSRVTPGVYAIPALFLRVRCVFSHETPVDAYRGAGRPEAIYAIERLMDLAARELGVDPLELRRRNFIRDFPAETLVGETYDVGDFDRVMTRALREADMEGFAARRAESEGRGRLRGLGLCYYIESILGDQDETTAILFKEDEVELHVGTQSNGQGHETVFAQFLHERLGVPFDKIRLVQGDTAVIKQGGGTGGSRSVTMQGGSIRFAADQWVDKARAFAAEELEVAGADLEFADGVFRIKGTDRSLDVMTLTATARARGRVELLEERDSFTTPGRSFPNGCHIAEVEVDPETGHLEVARYTVVDDFGLLVNPMLAEGQVHGGVVQGIGQALGEEAVYDGDGQLLTATFMDYYMPRAADAPSIPFHHEGVPSTANPIGMKGCGEAGTVGALAAVTNAGLDALWARGVRHVDMPMTPQKVWGWLRAAE